MRGADAEIDIAGLRARLAATVHGDVGFEPGDRALYTADASIYRRVPLGVVLPRSTDGVIATVAACREFGAPVVVRGAGTSVAGQATGTGVVIDTSRYLTKIHAIDRERRTAVVQPGVVLDRLNAAAAGHGLVFGPDPATKTRCTVGGMIGNNSCGAHSVAWGTTADNVSALDVLTYRGERYTVGPAADFPAVGALVDRYRAALRTGLPRLPRRSSGYLLDRLLPEQGGSLAAALVGTEGSCVTVLGATLRLAPAPAARALLVLGYPDDGAAADAAPALLDYRPFAVEGIDAQLVAALGARGRRPPVELPAGGGWLYVELGGEDPADAAARAGDVARALAAPAYVVVTEPRQQRALWQIREHGAGLASRMQDGSEAWPGWEDATVPPDRLGDYLREFRALLSAHGRRGIIYGHFGEGCLHVRIDFDLTSASGVAGYRRFLTEAADLVIGYGGVFSGEHGDGLARTELYERLFPAVVIQAFGEFKAIWDPDDRMNPGVAVRPARLDENLRIPIPAPPPPATVLGYPHDGGDFARALRRCVGVAACRSEHGGVMCPSFRVTRSERHATRGRARLLEEMLTGELITGGWRSPEVRDALDLCLSCKGCKSDCPVNVDMAAYKSEFLFHHYAWRLRPASHYSLGWLPLWLRAAQLSPALVNYLGGASGSARVLKRLTGIAAERALPELPAESLLRWCQHRVVARDGSPAGLPVLFWPDTFSTFLTPDVGRAAVTVLERAGFAVQWPDRAVCCGLTWLSTGQLRVARRVMRRALDVLAPAVAAGTPVVVAEPSCAAALRDDLPALLPDDSRAGPAAAGIRTFAELLDERVTAGWDAPDVGADAIVQTHCHQHAVLGFDADRRLMSRAGIRADVLDAGCCGLAGNFGFERAHYPVSMAVGELALLPAVRDATPETLVIADGLSCRLQIAHGTGRRAYHLAEVLARATAAT